MLSSAIARPLRQILPAMLALNTALAGCVSFSGLDEESTDLSGIQVGMGRAEVEAQLGPCTGVEPDETGRVHCAYHVKNVNHRPVTRAGTFVLDVLTLGMVTGACQSGFICDFTDAEYARLHLVYTPDGTLESYRIESEASESAP